MTGEPHCPTCTCVSHGFISEVRFYDSEDLIRQRRRDLDEALGTPKLRGSVDDEPIVLRESTERVG